MSLLLLAAFGARAAQTASFRLDAAASTSAGIYDSTGRLVRTMWSGRALPAGSVLLEWDGRDDDGQVASRDVQYEARLLSHNVRHEWEGVIGNTSDSMTGSDIHRAFDPVQDMAIDAKGRAFYVTGYNEGQHALHRFDASLPGRNGLLGQPDSRRVFRYVATDGELAYFANIGLVAPRGSPFRGEDSFVVAYRVEDGSEYAFPSGRRGAGDFRWPSAVDYEIHQIESRGRFPNAPSGLAVQQRGRKLFVSHRGKDEIRVFDKKEGRLLETIVVDDPEDIAIAPDDSFWVICTRDGRRIVARFSEQSGKWAMTRRISSSDIEPLAIGVSLLDGTLVVADGRSDQLHAYDDAGLPAWVFGRAGGYRAGGPEVRDDRLGFSAGPAYVAFQIDGSFWVGDPVNQRNLHFSQDRRLIGQIQYLTHSYVSTVDALQPARVFNGFLEFEVDYSRPLQKSWKLVRNWSVGLDSRYHSSFLEGIRAVATLDTGRTYASVFRGDGGGLEMVELAAGGMRPLGMRLRTEERLYPDGTLRFHLIRFGRLRVHERRPAGFDPSGAPRWSEPVVIAEVSGLADRDPWYRDVPLIPGMNEPAYPRTSNGLVVAFNPGFATGFHLGALRPGEDRWLWRASPAGAWEVDDRGKILNRDGRYDIGHGVQYPGNSALAWGSSIIFGYHGEGWNGGQANQWLHFHESGLFLGQFGEPAYVHNNVREAAAGTAGNAFNSTLVQVNGELYLWHNDESAHGGIHRWHIRGLDTIRIAVAPLTAP